MKSSLTQPLCVQQVLYPHHILADLKNPTFSRVGIPANLHNKQCNTNYCHVHLYLMSEVYWSELPGHFQPVKVSDLPGKAQTVSAVTAGSLTCAKIKCTCSELTIVWKKQQNPTHPLAGKILVQSKARGLK